MEPCIFCKIVSGQMQARLIYDDESCVAFHDIHPQSPVHVLIIPRKHFASGAEAAEEDEAVIGHLHRIAAQLATQLGVTGGYRAVINTGPDAGQTVFHLHLHLLGGRRLEWPPG